MSAVATAPGSASSRSFRDVWLISIGHSLTHWYPATFYLLLPLIGRELGLSYSEIGFIMTCQYVAGAVSNIPGGMVVDTVGRQGLLMAMSLFWVGVPYFLMSFTHSYWVLLLCVMLVGIGNNLWHPTAIPTLAQRFPNRKGLALSFHSMGGNLGDALAPLAVGALLAVLSWRSIVILNVIPGLVMASLILFYLGTLRIGGAKAKHRIAEEKHHGQSLREYFRGLSELLKNRELLMLSLGSGFRSLTQNGLLTFLPVFLAYEMGYSPFWVGFCMFVLQAAGFAASPVAGYLSDRMGRRRILMTSMLMTAVVLAFMAFAGRSLAFVLLIAVLGFFLYAIRPVLQAWTLECTPQKMGGTSIGVLFGVQAVGSSIGPAIGGVLADQYGLMSVFFFLAVTIVVANMFIFFMPSRALHASRAGAAAD
jgi:MFS family permease